MRDFGKVHTSIWASDTLKHLDADAKLLALYLLTSPHTTASGAFRLPDAYACEDLAWTAERLRNGFTTLSGSGFVERDVSTQWVWIKKWHEWNKPDNPNMRKAVLRMVDGIPSSVPFRGSVAACWDADLCLRETFSETVSEPLSNTPSPSPSPSLVSDLILDDGSAFVVTAELMAEYRLAYPRIDLTGEFGKMRAWLVSNPGNRKTRRGVTKFINHWLSKAQPVAFSAPQKSRKELGA